jgi:putative membrane protein
MTQEPVSGRHTSTEPGGEVSYDPAGGHVEPQLLTPPADAEQPLPPASQTAVSAGPQAGKQHQVRRSRFGGLWVGLIVATVILVLLLVFILQNSQSVRIDFFGMSGHAPLAVAILLGGAAGALLVAVPGTIRILQLRRAVRRDHGA